LTCIGGRYRVGIEAGTPRKENRMKALTTVAAITVLVLMLALPSGAGAATKWVCDVPDEGTVTFVTAADAARHGITQANSTAGAVFHNQFGESCHVE
jgi:hypothetical protein